MNGKSSYELPDLAHSMGAHLGIQFLEMEEGYVKAQMPVDERTCQPFGILNGGASLALAEIVAGHGSIPLCSANEMPCGIQVSAIGPNAGLGSRHNVSHWGCGAKEARISQAAWNRFYYYLTTDERAGDLMKEVTDADQKLYTLDPMRLAEPKSQFPCSAPARLRIGPDWLAYAGNWMTEWERTQNTKYRDKIITGMKSIAALKNGLFTGNMALGYDPATGVISYEGDPNRQNTNHLMTIMGGFEIMNEMQEMIQVPEFNKVWLEHARDYKQKALEITRNRFRVCRLMAYAASHLYDPKTAAEAWKDLWSKLEHTPAPEFKIEKVLPPEVPAAMDECKTISTNDAALWSLDAIYMQEVIPQ